MCGNRLSLSWYLEKTIELLKISPLENQFQDFIVYPILDSIINSNEIQELDLVNCHNFRQFNTACHNRCKYSVLVKAVPDLIIAKDFFYHNRDKQVFEALRTVASIEIKEPNYTGMLNKYVKSTDKGKEYADSLYRELLPSLFKNKKSILTNIRRWDFFDVSNVTDDALIDKIQLYVKILELCGFDASTDYEPDNSCNEDGNTRRGRKKLKRIVMDERWNELKEIEDLKEKIESINTELEKQHFDDIVKFADKKYIDEIKSYIQEAHIKSVDIILSKETLYVNQSFIGNMSDAGITSVSDLNYNCSKWDELFKEISKFVKMN